MKDERPKKYIFDPLYGPIFPPDFMWDVITCPELQRLREVRLCNINSLCLVGGANINRYEHAIGTFYLAQECVKARPPLNPLTEKEEKMLLLAALLHDVASAAFGHSVEYIESMRGFSHDRAFDFVALGEKSESYEYKLSPLEPIFFGLPRELLKKIKPEDLRLIGKIVAGQTRLGKLINSSIDLDNIDNVFRLAYHIGIVHSGEVPLKLARSFYIQADELILKKEALPLVEEWYRVRKVLYSLLLLNPEEFAAKCMLTEAIEVSKAKHGTFSWHDVDFELLQKLKDASSESALIISRLMKGDLYGCIGIFSSTKTDKYNMFRNTEQKGELEGELSRIIRNKFKPAFKSAMIAMHPIIDVNKTQRQIEVKTDDGNIVRIGKPTNHLLIAVFFKNVDLNINKVNFIPENALSKIRQEVRNYLAEVLQDTATSERQLYGELKETD